MRNIVFLFIISIAFLGCGSSSSDSGSNTATDSKYSIEYEGLLFYSKDMSVGSYSLKALTQQEFDALSLEEKYRVSDKLLATLFFGMTKEELEQHFDANDFISSIQTNLQKDLIDRSALESEILNEDHYYISTSGEQEAVTILARFYAMDKLDRYFFNNWSAYILTQTIMFSPAYELDSSHAENIARVYNRLVTLLDDEATMAFVTYTHMISDDNWRRFRSPEDNGREMLEIYTLDQEDSHVPIAAKALQNWSLDRDYDTLVIGLNENTTPLQLFGTTIYNGDDFYRELAKSSAFRRGVISRLVDFFFPDATDTKKASIISSLVQSNPKTWQDILKQIVFSKEYLLNTTRAKSAEELFYSLAKKMDYKLRTNSMHYFQDWLENMNQATMKYKLGKLTRVPLDTLSFAFFHKFIREEVFLRRSNPNSIDDYTAWDRQGWDQSFLDNENFTYDYTDEVESVSSFINYLFLTMINREANSEELAMFINHFTYLKENDTQTYFYSQFDIFASQDTRENNKRNIAIVVLDYLSRLDNVYIFKGVN
ncbi:hypothetical protein [Sulfurimonas sp.]|uniref:hypothetical protein n=1 Tax=Sulfurimonas sp. TaxID=2022749 RepID=UPI003D0FD902